MSAELNELAEREGGPAREIRNHIRDFRWRALQCRTNADAFSPEAAAIWDLAADVLEGK